MRVVHFQRQPLQLYFSMERVFETVRRHFPAQVNCRVSVARFPSVGLWRRVYNMMEAWWRQDEINHVTGDVHYLAILLRRRRTLLTIHDCVSLHRAKGLSRLLLWFFWYWLPIRRSGLVSVISEATKQDVLRQVRCDPAKIRVVGDPVTAGLEPQPKLGLPPKPVILQLGAWEHKNLERVAQALAGVPCHWRIIGALSAAQLDLVQKLGLDYSCAAELSDEQIREEYEKSDLLVFASTFEGFGMPIIEAQAVGRAVVTSNFGPMDEVAGDGAALVDPLDVASIRMGILAILRDDAYRQALIERGWANVQRFEAGRIARHYVKLYEELLQPA